MNEFTHKGKDKKEFVKYIFNDISGTYDFLNHFLSCGVDIIWKNNHVQFVGALENIITIPDAFHLRKPYPNPFNPVTTITYDIPMDCNIELSVYDLQGRLVKDLITDYVEAGYYEIQWNAGTASSGVYFLRLVASEKAITRKIILMK